MPEPAAILPKHTRTWWGLSRLVPRFWMPRSLLWTEVLYAGGIIGLWLLIVAWAAVRYWETPIRQQFPAWMEPVVLAKILWSLFALPCLVSTGLWLAGLMQPRDPTRLAQSDTERALERALFLLREKHFLRRFDLVATVLLLGMAGHIAWQVFRVGRPFVEWLPEAHLAGGALVLVLLGTTLRRNRFHPRARTFEIPGWFADLAASQRQEPGVRGGHTTRRDPAYEVIWPDDLPAFAFDLSPELPEPIRRIGVHVGPEVTRLMSVLLQRSGGALFRQRGCEAAADMINPFEGPLETIGLLEYQRLTAQILTRARVAKWDRATLASRILAFVQREIAYVGDEASTGYPEYGRFPLQTLVDGKGDCECKAILCCALLSYCGLDSALIVQDGHVVCGLRRPAGWLSWLHVFLTKRHAADYQFGETTSGDCKGEWMAPSPEQLKQVRKVVPVPAMDLSSDA